MNNLLKVALLFGLSISTAYAQDKQWQMELVFKGEVSPEKFESEVPEFAKEFYEPFLKGKMAYRNVEVLTDADYSSTIVNQKAHAILNRKLAKTYSYSVGDDVVTAEAYSPSYKIVSTKLEQSEGPYVQLQDMGEIESIAGITCKKAKLLIKNQTDSAIATVWYSEAMPTYYLTAFSFINDLPGGVLKLSLGENNELGFETTKVVNVSSMGDFQLPKNVKVIDISGGGSNSEGEDVSLFEDTFPLDKSLRWTMVKDKDTNDEYYGIKNMAGEEVLSCSLFSLAYFNEQTAIVSDKDNYFWLLDKKGEKVNKDGFDWLTPANQKLAIFQKDGNFGLVTQEGKVLLDKKENISKFLDSYLMFSENGKVGLLDENGKILLKANLLFLDADNAGNVLVREKDGEETKTLALDTFLKTYVK
ncbi:MAG: hypothetical protein LBV59_12145 [Sphingobacterium sp.]|jgi:hypothetical protein|uniref:hypothetical protein n=1 Tax=Sphingobacterium sp. TaxID=341027 RepID=UPI002840BF85|nr:hypothetical protein [Sphingobacterium sp.]MDR3008680.1 hypothetical protein [Sphingobacterium sp.]